jgi:hypothetical protein
VVCLGGQYEVHQTRLKERIRNAAQGQPKSRALSLEEKQRGRYQAVSKLDLPAGETFQIWLEEVAFPLLLAKQVFTNKDGSKGTLYLVTSDLTLNYDQMTKLYQKRSSR